MVAMPESAVFSAGTEGARVAVSAPVTVTVAPTMTALLGSTTVTRRVAVAAGCAKPRDEVAAVRHRASRAVFIPSYLTYRMEQMSCPIREQCIPRAVNVALWRSDVI